MAPEETTMTSWPRLRRCATSAAKLSNQARLRRPLSASTSNADPTLTTIRLASARRRARTLRSAMFMCMQYCHLLSAAASPNIRLDSSTPVKKGRSYVGREYEPTVGQWYDDLENEETFQVLKVDEDKEIVEIQHLDGDIEEFDVDGWAELDLELTEEPEGWSGSKAEKEDDEDDDEDEDWDEDEDDEDDDEEDLDDEEDREEY